MGKTYVNGIKHDDESETKPNQGPQQRRANLRQGEPESIAEGAKKERRKLWRQVKIIPCVAKYTTHTSKYS